MIKKIVYFFWFDRIVNIGVTQELDIDSSVHVQMTNLVGLLVILSNIQYSILFHLFSLPFFWKVNAVNLFIATSLCFVFYFNYLKKYSIAKFCLELLIPIPIVICILYFSGPMTGFHYFFLIFAMVPFLIFNYKSRIWILVFFLQNMFLYVYFEFFFLFAITAPNSYFFSPQVQSFFKVNSVVSCLFFIALLMFIFLRNTQIYQTELQKNNVHKDRIFSILAHDLRGPIGSMSSYLELMLERRDITETIRTQLEILRNNSNQSYMVLENLLTWVNLDKMKAQYFPKGIQLSKLIDDAKSLLQMIADNKQIEWEIDILDLKVFCDERMTSSIFRNLVTNAIKYSKPHGKLRITSELDGDFAKIVVVDNGVGISEAQLKKITQGEKIISEVGTAGERGTGLGLMVVMEMIQDQGGSYQIRSSLGMGTSFFFTLPLAK